MTAPTALSRTYRIMGSRDVVVTGTSLGLINRSAADMGPSETWPVLELWQLEGGDWLAARSMDANLPDGYRSEIKRIHKPAVEQHEWEGPTSEAAVHQRMVDQTMKFYEWSWGAKLLADQLGWRVIETIG